MEIPFYQTTWQGLDFKDLSGKKGDVNFYSEFYSKINQAKIQDTEWIQHKLICAQWLENKFIKNICPTARILSLGAGKGVIEKPLLAKGYHVDLQDCQSESLKNIHLEFPEAIIHISDALKLSNIPDNSYDLTYCIALDYVFTFNDYVRLWKEAYRVTKKGGGIIFVSVSHIHPKQVLHEMLLLIKAFLSKVKHIFLFKNNTLEKKVFWGWKRGLDDHWKAIKKSQIPYSRCVSGLLTDFEMTDLAHFEKPIFLKYLLLPHNKFKTPNAYVFLTL